MQRLYKRRKVNSEGYIESNWSVLGENSVIGGYNPDTDIHDDEVKHIIWDGGIV